MLATTRELATFHADRALFYRVIAELVGTPPTAKSLRTLAAAVTGTTERGAARAALEAAIVTADPAAIVAEYERLVRDPAAPITTRCAGDAELYRHEAFTSSGRAEDERPASEALVLAALAERAARAIRRTDLAEASALLALQHRFLERHAKGCLGALAERLARAGEPAYAGIGQALEQLIREDLALLDHEVAPLSSPR